METKEDQFLKDLKELRSTLWDSENEERRVEFLNVLKRTPADELMEVEEDWYCDQCTTTSLLGDAISNNNMRVVEAIVERVREQKGEEATKAFLNRSCCGHVGAGASGIEDTPLSCCISEQLEQSPNMEMFCYLILQGARLDVAFLYDDKPMYVMEYAAKELRKFDEGTFEKVRAVEKSMARCRDVIYYLMLVRKRIYGGIPKEIMLKIVKELHNSRVDYVGWKTLRLTKKEKKEIKEKIRANRPKPVKKECSAPNGKCERVRKKRE